MGRSGRGGGPGQLRIIGGDWRGRKLRFSPAEGLRPTGDRIRETLFNWLTAHIRDARCLDLFAGSGALGLEALSRGAAHCDFVDISTQALQDIASHLQSLQASDRGACHNQDAAQYLARGATPWDIVFIDPPFGKALAGPVCRALADSALLAPGAFVYLETGAEEVLPELPASWSTHREKVSGGVAYRLLIV